MRGDPEPKQVRVSGIYFFIEVPVPAPLVRPVVLSGVGLPPTPGKPRHPVGSSNHPLLFRRNWIGLLNERS
ncbi:unnamed protein product [Coccothraustes coccothraustes]